MTSAPAMRLTRLSFTGKDKEVAAVDFARAVSLFYGSSNAGKSFILKAVDYILGSGDPFPGIEQSAGYEHVFLSFVLEPEGRPVTLRRSTRGGDIEWIEGASDEVSAASMPSEGLGTRHGKARKGATSLSEKLLGHLGVHDAKIAVTQAGKKDTFSIRNFMPYLLVDETSMLGDESPLRQHSRSMSGADKNLFRFIMTGMDDSSIVRVQNSNEAKTSKAAKAELLETMITEAEARIARFPESFLIDFVDGKGSDGVEDEVLSSLGDTFAEAQTKLDRLRVDRRNLMIDIDDVRDEASEIDTSLMRYGDLEKTFISDIRRLKAIEEGGYFLLRFDDQPCPVCGAEPGNQHRPHEQGELERQHQASVVEIAKIERDIKDLRELIVSLTALIERLRGRERRLKETLDNIDAQIKAAVPQEASLRRGYLDLQSKFNQARLRSEAIAARDALQRQLDEVKKLKTSQGRAEGITMGIAPTVGHELSMVVADVLRKWEYPRVDGVVWNPETDDIQVNGHQRRQNGKGVRAIYHSALKVAVLIYCRQKSLPHPGFVFLDSPLLTYRGPLLYEKYGELDSYEKQLAATPLSRRFYEHLSSLAGIGQFIVVENTDPPSGIESLARVQAFAGENGDGRQGLFPSLT
ncbi:hypothetical protein DBIPINDM_007921 (plasmid) [Mesorhizobium sp. AR02]|uniref:hypothetical protein n=1 Tax=Mesorhizobium sp. AR02 TaxID=2865837 RepID=UPI00215E331D|nr:hypothetical protein [Mesorhizobium sp. AR02]UVK49844.1 hypothetical protein DBIPINDM_007921 [Mesorhizobium sp. AR02]